MGFKVEMSGLPASRTGTPAKPAQHQSLSSRTSGAKPRGYVGHGPETRGESPLRTLLEGIERICNCTNAKKLVAWGT